MNHILGVAQIFNYVKKKTANDYHHYMNLPTFLGQTKCVLSLSDRPSKQFSS